MDHLQPDRSSPYRHDPLHVKPGRVMFEMEGVTEEIAREAMRLAAHKLPIKCKFVKKEEEEA